MKRNYTIHSLLLISTIVLFSDLRVNAQDVEGLLFVDYKTLVETKNKIQQNDLNENSEFDALIKSADQLLVQEPYSVMQKKRTPPSGDKHDYLSLAPYWWPDPQQKDGLPYIRHDGKVNPSTRGENVDYDTKKRFFNALEILSLAFFYSDNEKYAIKAIQLLDTWFIDPTTLMNPHLEYAQGVPGRSDGRGFGIIEWCDIDKVLTAIQILRLQNVIPDPIDQAIRRWFDDYVHWLLYSEKGRFESERLNNHGTWYDVQVSDILLFLDRKKQAREILEKVKTKRIAIQIEPDGRQPHELARTKSLSYSKMNLRAFKRLVQLGMKVGVDLWNYETPDGRSIPKANSFLSPYINENKEWNYPQLKPGKQIHN